MKKEDTPIHLYEDIIHLPHHVSKNHGQMSRLNRAAQFSPFAAVTGYDGAIKETGRLTVERIELDENEKNRIDNKLKIIQEKLNTQKEVEIIFFRPDGKKIGGIYISKKGVVEKINKFEHTLIMTDKTQIQIDDIIDICL